MANVLPTCLLPEQSFHIGLLVIRKALDLRSHSEHGKCKTSTVARYLFYDKLAHHA